MKVNRHGKPSKAYLSTLHEPKDSDYERMVSACLEVLLNGEKDVRIAFPYVMKFPKDFPKGILEEKVGASNIHRIKANKLLTWLHNRGYTPINMELLRQQQIKFTKFVDNFTGSFLTEEDN